jgi:HEAT repeat protein
VDIDQEFDHLEVMASFRYLPLALLLAGCGSSSQPAREVATAVSPPGGVAQASFVAAEAADGAVTAPPRAIFDFNVAPAEYSLKPLSRWTEQEAAADALGRIGPAAVPELIAALRSTDAEARLQATQVLARMGSDAKEAVPDLIRLLDDPDERIRKAATRTLGRIGPDASEAVPALMKSLLEK